MKVKASELKRQKYITYGGDPGTPPGPRSGFAGSGLFPNKEWEDLCFRCYDEGELLMCDYRTCPKVGLHEITSNGLEILAHHEIHQTVTFSPLRII